MTRTMLEGLTDAAVIEALDDAVRDERHSTVRVLRCMIEFERRRLHETRAYPSFFEYCTRHLGYSPEAAYKRIRAARAAANYSHLLEHLDQGCIKLSAVVVISSQLTRENQHGLIEKAMALSIRDLEFFVAGLAPRKPVRDCIRVEHGDAQREGQEVVPVLPAVVEGMCGAVEAVQGPGAIESAHKPSGTGPLQRPARVEPVNDHLARVSFTASRETVADIERACALLHARRGDLGPVFARALKALLREIDPEARSAARRVRKSASRGAADAGGGVRKENTRRIPQAVRDAVWKRDGGQCTYRDAAAKRCCATAGLEFDHMVPWALGGLSDDPRNIRLLCRLHNHAAARERFGGWRVDRAFAARRVSARGGLYMPP